MIKIHNAATGEIVEREMNAEELAQYESDQATLAQEITEAAAKEAARQSALDKLAALGLTPEEIAALS